METTQGSNPVQPYVEKFKKLSKPQQLVLVGAVVVLVALFTPVSTVTVFGVSTSLSFFQWSTFWSLVMLGGAGSAAYFAYLNDFKKVMMGVALSAVAAVVSFLMVMNDTNSVNNSTSDYGAWATALKTGVSFGYGWVLLVAGEAALVAGYVMDMKKKKSV